MSGKLERLARKTVMPGKVVDLCQDTVRLPDGKIEQWDFVHHKKGCGAAIVPVLPDGRILLVRQYRPAVGEEVLELPAGGRDGEESLTETATRELLEETGYRAERLTFLCRARTAVAWCDEYTEVYLAEDLQKTPSRHLDEAEDIRMEIHTKEELLAMIAEGTLSDAKTIAGIALYCAKQSKTE